MNQLLIGDILRTSAARTPGNIAASLDGQSVTFAQLEEQAQTIAAALFGTGIRPGDRVAWQAETCLEAVALYFAAARIGAVFVPLNPRYTSEETSRVLAHADPALVLGDAASGHATLASLTAHASGTFAEPEVDENSAQVIFYTSGTTGEPKGVMLSHRAQRLRTGRGVPWPSGPAICMFPQFHMAGWGRSIEHWLEGTEVVFVRRPDAEDLMDAISRHRGESIYCIPAVWQRILDADRGGYDLSSLTRIETGTSAVSAGLIDGLTRLLPRAVLSIAYGSTEAGLVCMLGPADVARKPGSVGLPAAGVQVRLDEGGELLVNCPHLFSGYFRNQDATERVMADGWFRTGDLAERDADGHYAIVGRAGDLIRTGGETVAPVEVELALRTCPGIADIAIVGVPDERWGEIITAFVVPAQAATPTLDDLREHCRNQLATHKHPRSLVIVDTLPRTGATGQIQRRLLLERTAEQKA